MTTFTITIANDQDAADFLSEVMNAPESFFNIVICEKIRNKRERDAKAATPIPVAPDSDSITVDVASQ